MTELRPMNNMFGDKKVKDITDNIQDVFNEFIPGKPVFNFEVLRENDNTIVIKCIQRRSPNNSRRPIRSGELMIMSNGRTSIDNPDTAAIRPLKRDHISLDEGINNIKHTGFSDPDRKRDFFLLLSDAITGSDNNNNNNNHNHNHNHNHNNNNNNNHNNNNYNGGRRKNRTHKRNRYMKRHRKTRVKARK
jgi:hypothetical protein